MSRARPPSNVTTTLPVYVGRQPRVTTTTSRGSCAPTAAVRVGSYAGPGPVAPPDATCTTRSVDNYYQNTPLWSRPYTYCTSDADCAFNTVDAVRCLAIHPDTPCNAATPFSCICSNAVRGPF